MEAEWPTPLVRQLPIGNDKNAGQVALEMGNSAAIVLKHYFDIVEASAAREYCSIMPIAHGSSKVVHMA